VLKRSKKREKEKGETFSIPRFSPEAVYGCNAAGLLTRSVVIAFPFSRTVAN
jgi:hypothetical protein